MRPQNAGYILEKYDKTGKFKPPPEKTIDNNYCTQRNYIPIVKSFL